MIDWEENKPQALVITPTRELAVQVREDCFHIGRFKKMKVAAALWPIAISSPGKGIEAKNPYRRRYTPGRLIDHLERGTFDPNGIKYLVIDEADEMLRMGFVEQVETIIAKRCLKDRVTIVLSATMPADIAAICAHHMREPTRCVDRGKRSGGAADQPMPD